MTRLAAFAVSFALIAQAFAKDPERLQAAGGQTIIKEFYDDGTIKTITRLNPDGSLLGALFHDKKGVATHADYYDEQKRVRRRLFYREDGTPKSAKEFDENGKVVLEYDIDAAGNPIHAKKPK